MKAIHGPATSRFRDTPTLGFSKYLRDSAMADLLIVRRVVIVGANLGKVSSYFA